MADQFVDEPFVIREKEDNSAPNYRLKTVLTETGLNIALVVVDMQSLSGKLYTLAMSDADMPYDLYHVFGNLESLFEKCFEKMENYRIEQDGRIVFFFKIILNADELDREIELKLNPVDGVESDQAVIDKMASEFVHQNA